MFPFDIKARVLTSVKVIISQGNFYRMLYNEPIEKIIMLSNIITNKLEKAENVLVLI